MSVWTERNKGFVSCSDFVGYGNSLSNVLTFLLSYTKLITLTALELAIGFLEGFCYLLFLASEMIPFKTLRTLNHFAVIQPPTNAKYIFFQGGLLLFLPVCINVKWKIRKLLLSKVMSSRSVLLYIFRFYSIFYDLCSISVYFYCIIFVYIVYSVICIVYF